MSKFIESFLVITNPSSPSAPILQFHHAQTPCFLSTPPPLPEPNEKKHANQFPLKSGSASHTHAHTHCRIKTHKGNAASVGRPHAHPATSRQVPKKENDDVHSTRTSGSAASDDGDGVLSQVGVTLGEEKLDSDSLQDGQGSWRSTPVVSSLSYPRGSYRLPDASSTGASICGVDS